jgi:NTP pyrophosphatase (non-canonical NTP hydrolase)
MLHEVIGIPAMLEQTAEECCELAQACLKMARFYRMENDPYKSFEEIYDNFAEELADINICMVELYGAYDEEQLSEYVKIWADKKLDRMNERLVERFKNEED